jgi:endonuclease VIII
VPDDVIRQLWRDWCYLLGVGVETGQMLTIDGVDAESRALALRDPSERHWVYKRQGLPCRVCGTHIVMELAAARKLYFCPNCQS